MTQRAAKKARRSTGPRLTHNVYVVELDDRVLNDRRFRDRNPLRRAELPCLYVGMTGLPVERRFDNHKRGYKSNRYVQQHGLRLRPDLFAFLNPMPYAHARRMEVELAEELRGKGYAVWQG